MNVLYFFFSVFSFFVFTVSSKLQQASQFFKPCCQPDNGKSWWNKFDVFLQLYVCNWLRNWQVTSNVFFFFVILYKQTLFILPFKFSLIFCAYSLEMEDQLLLKIASLLDDSGFSDSLVKEASSHSFFFFLDFFLLKLYVA